MNKVWLMARLTKDPDIRRTQNDMLVARFTLAVDRFKKDQGADFINCVCFDKRAEAIQKYVSKGTKISVEGHIQTGSYEKDGHKVYTTDIIVDNWEFAESKGSKNEIETREDADGFMSIPDGIDEELPFI